MAMLLMRYVVVYKVIVVSMTWATIAKEVVKVHFVIMKLVAVMALLVSIAVATMPMQVFVMVKTSIMHRVANYQFL